VAGTKAARTQHWLWQKPRSKRRCENRRQRHHAASNRRSVRATKYPHATQTAGSATHSGIRQQPSPAVGHPFVSWRDKAHTSTSQGQHRPEAAPGIPATNAAQKRGTACYRRASRKLARGSPPCRGPPSPVSRLSTATTSPTTAQPSWRFPVRRTPKYTVRMLTLASGNASLSQTSQNYTGGSVEEAWGAMLCM
jgi:hypothetical protein